MIILIIFLTLFVSGYFIRIQYRAETDHDELHYAITDDGVHLALYRYLPKKGQAQTCPIILCHGVTSNRFTWDLMEVNFARYLADKGHDVWSLELRGSQGSRQTTSGKQISLHFNFDDHVEKDLPAAIDHVISATSSNQVDWIGHSMGGMLLYAYLTQFKDNRIRRGCAIGSPGTMKKTPRIYHKVTFFIPPYRYYPLIHTNFFLTFFLPFVRLGLVWTDVVVNRKNTTPKYLTAMAVNVIGDVSTRLGLHLAYMVRKGNLRQFPPGDFSYENNLSNITIPLLLVSGAKDLLGPPFRLKHVLDNISSKEKHFIECSVKNGYCADYGHTDLILGNKAKDEVWPGIAQWFE